MENLTPDQMKVFFRMMKLGICIDFMDDDADDSFMTENELKQFEKYCSKLKNRKKGVSLRELSQFVSLHCVRQDPTGRCLRAAYEAGLPAMSHQSWSKNTPLHITAFRGFPDAVKVVLAAGVDVSAVDAQGLEALFYAVQGVRNNAGRGTEADYYKIFRMIVEAKGGIDRCTSYTSKSTGKERPMIFLACESGSTRIVKDLIDAGVDINIRDDMKCDARTRIKNGVDVLGETPLHFAVKSGNLKLVKLMLKNGADTRARTFGEQAYLPVEKIINGDYNMRIANEIFKWELDHNINVNDTPPVEKGLIHCSDVNVDSIRRSVEQFLETGEVTGEVSSMPMFRMYQENPDSVYQIEELSNQLESHTIGKKLCTACFKEAPDLKKCGRCKAVFYCNSVCQKNDWQRHKKSCSKS